jgi:hypothetical protein
VAEQAVWHLKRVTLRIPVPSGAALRTRAWMAGPPLLLGLLAALVATQLQASTWRSHAEVSFDVSNIGLAASTPPTSLAGASLWPAVPTRFPEAQATVARSPELAARVVQAADVPGITAARFLQHSSAKPVPDADILNLSVTYRRRSTAVRLANAYANEFVRFRYEQDLRPVTQALRHYEEVLRRLRARGLTKSDTYLALLNIESQVKALGAQLQDHASVLQPADGASSFRPHALRNGLLGAAVGVLLGLALVGVVTGRRRLRR